MLDASHGRELDCCPMFIAESCLPDIMLLTANHSTGCIGPIGHFVKEGAACCLLCLMLDAGHGRELGGCRGGARGT